MASLAQDLISGGRTIDIQRLIGSSYTASYKTQDISQAFGFNFRLQSIGSKIPEAWPEEQKAFEDIITGKTKMIRQTGHEFLKELNDVLDE